MLSDDEEHRSDSTPNANSDIDQSEISTLHSNDTYSDECVKNKSSQNIITRYDDSQLNEDLNAASFEIEVQLDDIHSAGALSGEGNFNSDNYVKLEKNVSVSKAENRDQEVMSHASLEILNGENDDDQQLSVDLTLRAAKDDSTRGNDHIYPSNQSNGIIKSSDIPITIEESPVIKEIYNVSTKNVENLKSKSVSPPPKKGNQVSSSIESKITKEEKKSAFSSLNNLASRFLESRNKDNVPIISASMSDLDKFAEQPFLIGKSRNSTFGDSSSITSDDFDAYDALKKEAASLDESMDEDSNIHLESCLSPSELEINVKKLGYELDVANGTIKHVYEESSKRLHEVSMQYESKIAHIDKKFIECIREKDEINKSLDECMDARRKLQSNKENLIKSMSNQADENERLRAKLHVSTDDCIRLKKDLDARNSEVLEMKKFVKKLQDDLSTASVKVQWSDSKLKSECDSHHLTRTKLAGMDSKIREAKEEANIIRSNCQAIIDKYQNSEEIQSNALGSKLEKLELEHSDLLTNHAKMSSKYETMCKDYEDVNRQMEQIKDQLFEKDADYRRVLKESKCREQDKNQLADKLEDLDERLNSHNELKTELKNAYQNNQLLDSEIIELREKLKSSETSNISLYDKEKGNLEYFQKISSKNAELQLEVNGLKIEGEGNQNTINHLSNENKELKLKHSEISGLYSEQVSESKSTNSKLNATVSDLEKCRTDLECEVHDLKNDALVSKRKHQADNKDLIRQIEQFRKQFERQEESMRRSESVNSLESAGKAPNRSGASSEAEDSTSLSNDSGATLSLGNAGTLLVERLCSLQKVLAKRQEKIEFYESHVNTLTRDVQKKTRIIQNLLLRVETGERTKLASDAYKKSQPSDSFLGHSSNGVTLKLSMEINEKLQQVLEDTLFKNITLKENIKTLGNEIDRLNKR